MGGRLAGLGRLLLAEFGEEIGVLVPRQTVRARLDQVVEDALGVAVPAELLHAHRPVEPGLGRTESALLARRLS